MASIRVGSGSSLGKPIVISNTLETENTTLFSQISKFGTDYANISSIEIHVDSMTFKYM